MDERPHPNLRKEIFLNVQLMESNRSKLESLGEEEWRKLVKKIFEKQGLETYPEDYPFEEREEFSVVIYDENEETDEVFRGILKVPSDYQGEDADSADIYEVAVEPFLHSFDVSKASIRAIL